MKTLVRNATTAVLSGLLLAALPSVSSADEGDGFYAGKTVSVIIRSTAGGGYDYYGRLIARHLGKYLPGNPNVIAVNRPGAGGLVAANYLYNRAPKDGTEILIAARELALAERMDSRGVRYETMEFEPLGSAASVHWVWPAAPDGPVDNLDDLESFKENQGRNFRFAVSGKGAGSYTMSLLLKRAGYPVEMISGYEGSSERLLAILRGEADGSSESWGSSRQTIEDEGLKVIAKLGNIPSLPDVPDVRKALPDKIRPLVSVLATPLLAGRPFFAPPGTPEERVKDLQEAFRKVIQDPDVQKEAERAGREVGYTSPEEMKELYRDILNAPDDVIEMAAGE